MALTKNTSEESREFWKAAESNVRKIEGWPEWKKNIVVTSAGSGYVSREIKAKGDSSGKNAD